ncbi:MAG: ankyrin repeat domain-containing protein, partial [Lentisphaeria bacterium]|nr:ankyrin repeat domain-containing protein [Lentisphaeria bacterium]
LISLSVFGLRWHTLRNDVNHRAEADDLVGLRRILKARPYLVNQRTLATFETPLHLACGMEVVEYLIDRGADVNARDLTGTSRLHQAVADNHAAEVKLLLRSGADTENTDEAGETPIWHASAKMARLLIENGADIDHKNNHGESLLIYLLRVEDSPSVVEMLLEQGASPNKADRRGVPPLYHALSGSMTDAKACRRAALLLDHGADPNFVLPADTRYVYRPAPYLHVAVRKGFKEVTKLLLKHGVDVNARDSTGRTALECALDAEVRALLLEHGATATTEKPGA